MTPREHFIAALERRPVPGVRVPHFELVFFLTMEVFGRVHPHHRSYSQWQQMEEKERQLHREDMADLFIQTAERYDHSAILLHPNPKDFDETCRLLDLVRRRTGDKYFLMIHGDATYGIPGGNGMTEFAVSMMERPQQLKEQARKRIDRALERARKLQEHGELDGFALCADYCFNNGPFMRPTQFGEFVAPYLKDLIAGYRELGFYTIKHTDGNIMPIIDQLVDARPHALHSLDPQGGVDIATVAARYGDRVALCGNVNCGLMQTGTEEECAASARASLAGGMRAPGYIFCTSNCVYTGLALGRYELVHDIWRREGVRPEAG
jgi:uroporphyrinogen decarboxylase